MGASGRRACAIPGGGVGGIAVCPNMFLGPAAGGDAWVPHWSGGATFPAWEAFPNMLLLMALGWASFDLISSSSWR